MRIVPAVMRIVLAVVLSIIGSTAIVLAVDHLLFTRGTWSSWQLVVVPVVGHDETAWWKSRVGPLPPAGTTTNIVAPTTVRGRDGLNADGAPAPHGARLLYGLIAYRMKTQFPMIRGGVLISPTTHAWRVGVELPGGMAVERIYLGLPGQAPPHPTFGGWELRILPVGLLINSLYVAAPLCVVVAVFAWFSAWAFRRIRGSIRRAHSRCPACAYLLLPEQNTCPECGYQDG